MSMFYVYKKDWDHYVESKGVIVIAKNCQRAKDIAMDKWEDQNKNNIEVKEINLLHEGIVCSTDRIETVQFNNE